MKFIPIGSKLVVKVIKEEYSIKSGIVLNYDAEDQKEKYHKGIIVKIGNGKINEDGTHEKLDAKVGDKILFPKYAGDNIKIDNENYVVLPFSDVKAVIFE